MKNNQKEMGLFKKITALPYLLVFLALLMPLANVSCSAKDDSKPIAEMTIYQMASGVDLDKSLEESAMGQLQRMLKGNPKILDHFKSQMPNFPRMEPVHQLYGILIAVFLAAAFAWFVPLASIIMGLLSMVSLWSLLMKFSQVGETLGIPLLKVDAGAGLYCASFLILIGTAMNIATMMRPTVVARRERRKVKKMKKKEIAS